MNIDVTEADFASNLRKRELRKFIDIPKPILDLCDRVENEHLALRNFGVFSQLRPIVDALISQPEV